MNDHGSLQISFQKKRVSDSTNIYALLSLPGAILSGFYQGSQSVIQGLVLICKLLPVSDRISSICQNVNKGTTVFSLESLAFQWKKICQLSTQCA